MSRTKALFFTAFFLLLGICACSTEEPLSPTEIAPRSMVMETAASPACWGQVTAVFAAMGEMGEHASQEPTPRLGLHNLARALFEAGVIEDDSMAALGQFVADELGLSIDACM